MGRFRPTATMQVYAFEEEWRQFSKSPHKATREAFAELIAMAHFHAAAIAHAASTHVFEMIGLTMLVGLVRRADTLQGQGLFAQTPDAAAFQANARTVMSHLRRRLADQRHELYTLARAFRTEDQAALRTLLQATQSNGQDLLVLKPTPDALLLLDDATDEALLGALVEGMRWLRRLEKQNEGRDGIVSLEEWSRLCCVT